MGGGCFSVSLLKLDLWICIDTRACAYISNIDFPKTSTLGWSMVLLCKIIIDRWKIFSLLPFLNPTTQCTVAAAAAIIRTTLTINETQSLLSVCYFPPTLALVYTIGHNYIICNCFLYNCEFFVLLHWCFLLSSERLLESFISTISVSNLCSKHKICWLFKFLPLISTINVFYQFSILI